MLQVPVYYRTAIHAQGVLIPRLADTFGQLQVYTK